MHVVILAGGKATRLGALARERPKSLVPVLGRPFVDWQLQLLLHQGFEDFTFCIGHLGAQIKAHIEHHWRDLHPTFSDEGTDQRGPWAAYRRAKIKGRHAVIYGDSYLPLAAEQVKRWYESDRRVYLRWQRQDYGIRFLPGELEMSIEAPCPWHEVGTAAGIAELEDYLRRAA